MKKCRSRSKQHHNNRDIYPPTAVEHQHRHKQ